MDQQGECSTCEGLKQAWISSGIDYAETLKAVWIAKKDHGLSSEVAAEAATEAHDARARQHAAMVAFKRHRLTHKRNFAP
jgi:hypothetical protein